MLGTLRDETISSQDQEIGKVQRLGESRKPKWVEMGDKGDTLEDIVRTTWRHVAALQRGGIRVTNLYEQNVLQKC